MEENSGFLEQSFEDTQDELYEILQKFKVEWVEEQNRIYFLQKLYKLFVRFKIANEHFLI